MGEKFIVHPEVRKKLEKFIEDKKGIVNFTLDIESGSVKGDNYLGVIAKATVNGTDKNGRNVVFNWIVKSAPQLDAFRKVANLKSIYEREIYMYDEIFPLYQKFQIDKSVFDPFTSTAFVHMTCVEEYQECLVMEDMKSLGYQMKDRMQPLDYNHVRLVLRAYGQFHAISYALKDQKPDEFRKIVANTEESFFRHLDNEHIRNHAKSVAEKALNSLDPVRDKDAAVLFRKYADKSYAVLLEAFEMSYKHPYSVIGHGDSWVNNMLFKYDDPKRPSYPTDVCLLDFQLAKYGSPAFDLSYFIFTCTDKNLRDKYYEQMIATYYAAFCWHLVDLGSDPQKLLPFHVLESQLKRFSVVGLYMTLMVLQLMMSETDEIPDLSEIMSEEDMGTKFQLHSRNDDYYYERVRGIIIDFVEKGYFDFLK